MDFTFGIVTNNYTTDSYISTIVDSINRQKIQNYEIFIIGGIKIDLPKVNWIEFNDIRPYTVKKNLITKLAQYENVVYMHDYIKFNDNWYNGHVISGNNFDIKMDMILDINGNRYLDWLLWEHNYIDNKLIYTYHSMSFLDYSVSHLSKFMYINGSYWIAKKNIMEEFPLNETLNHHQGEDVEWSKRVREKYSFSMNTYSKVHLLKNK